MNRQLQVRRQGNGIAIYPKELLTKPEYRIQVCNACPFVEICSRTLIGKPPMATIPMNKLRELLTSQNPNQPFESLNLTKIVGGMANCTLSFEQQKSISMDASAQRWIDYTD